MTATMRWMSRDSRSWGVRPRDDIRRCCAKCPIWERDGRCRPGTRPATCGEIRHPASHDRRMAFKVRGPGGLGVRIAVSLPNLRNPCSVGHVCFRTGRHVIALGSEYTLRRGAVAPRPIGYAQSRDTSERTLSLMGRKPSPN